MNDVASVLIEVLGLEGVTLIAVLSLLSLVSQLVAKLIPDDSAGLLGVVRRVFKVLGLYVDNRITQNTTVADPARDRAGLLKPK